MTNPAIVCVDDQREVLSSLLKDIDVLSTHFDIMETESGDEALELLDELDSEGKPIALIISDHVMPGMTGVDFLSEVFRDGRFSKTRKLLLTGLATHEDTIRAINEARIDSYIAKPWSRDALLLKIRQLVTHFVFDTALDYTKFDGSLDPDTLLERSKP